MIKYDDFEMALEFSSSGEEFGSFAYIDGESGQTQRPLRGLLSTACFACVGVYASSQALPAYMWLRRILMSQNRCLASQTPPISA